MSTLNDFLKRAHFLVNYCVMANWVDGLVKEARRGENEPRLFPASLPWKALFVICCALYWLMRH